MMRTLLLLLLMSPVLAAQAPAPPASAATPMSVIAPAIPPAYVVDLTTQVGMAAFNAR